MKTLRIPGWGRWLLPFIIYHLSFIICFAQTRSAVMVTNATGKLAAPTNFFIANQPLLNQAVSNVPGFGTGGGGGISSFDPGTFGYNAGGGTNAAGLSNNLVTAIQTQATNSTNFARAIAAACTNALNLASYATQLYAQGLTNALNLGQYLLSNGGSGTGNNFTNPNLQWPNVVGGLSFPGTAAGGPSWQFATNNNTFLILDTNGNVIFQLTNNQQGVAINANVAMSNLFLVAANPMIKHGGTAQWIGNINFAGGLTQGGNTLVSGTGGQGSNNVFSGMTSTNGTNAGHVTFTNLNGSGVGISYKMGSTLFQVSRGWGWGGNPDAWEEWVAPGSVWWQDTNSQHVIDLTNITDSIGLHGNVTVDSNFTAASATITGNISAANLGTAAGSNGMQFVGAIGGQSSNGIFYLPQTTNLTEQGNLTVKGQINSPHFNVDTFGDVTNGGNTTIGGNFTANGAYNKFTHPQNGQEKLDINLGSLSDTDALLVQSGANLYGYNYPTGVSPEFQTQPDGALNVAFINYNITNANGNLALYDSFRSGPTWNVIVQTAAGNSTLTLPTSTNWSMSIWGGNATSHASTLFGSNTVMFHVLNDGGGIETVCTADHAPVHILTNGSYVAVTNPSIAPGQFMLLAYGGSNGTSIINLANTYAATSAGGGSLNALSFTNYQGSNVVYQTTQTGGQGVTIASKTNATIDASFDDVFYVQTNALNFSNIINVNCATNQTRRGLVHIKPAGNYTIGFNYAANCTLIGAYTTNWLPVGASNGYYTLAWEIMFTNFNSNTCTYAIVPPNN